MNKSLAVVGFLTATALWGGTFVFIKQAVQNIDPSLFIFYRFSTAALFFICLRPNFWQEINSKLCVQAIMLGVLLGMTVLCQTIALRTIGAALASFMTGTALIWVIIFNSVFAKIKINLWVMLSVFSALTGLGILTWKDHQFSFEPGIFWISACAFFFGAYIYYSKSIANHQTIFLMTLLQFITISILALVVLKMNSVTWIWPFQFTWSVWQSILYCGILASGIAFYLQLRSQINLSTHLAGVLFLTEPFFATIAAKLMLHEQLSPNFWCGCLFLVLSAVLANHASFSRKKSDVVLVP